MAAAVALAWLGMYVHNVMDLPDLTPASPENTGPALVWLALLGLWWAQRDRPWPAALLLGWAGLNLLGALITVLPLPVLPFKPEQSLRHYAFHALYVLAVTPVLVLLRLHLRSFRAEPSC